MSQYLDRMYLAFVSAQLRNFKQKSDDTWNFSCPFCGDSQTNHLKARGYMFNAREYNGLGFHCHNCNVSTNFTSFLKHLDPGRYKEYIMEKFKTQTTQPVDQPSTDAPVEPMALLSISDIKLLSIDQLPEDHFARVYITHRRVPTKHWNEIFFAPDFKLFMDSTFPDHGKEKLPENDPRIVMFYTNRERQITNVSGRSFGSDPKLRYLTVKVSDQRKVYGLHRLNLDRRIYITEGQFDSMFLNNAVASGDSNLVGLADWLFDEYGVNPVIIFDNEPRNREIVQGIAKAIKHWDVVIWPDNVVSKDINDMVLNGWPLPSIHSVIREHTYSGLQAELRLTGWRKC